MIWRAHPGRRRGSGQRDRRCLERLVQALKSGRWRVPGVSAPQAGTSTARLRAMLDRLPDEQQRALALAIAGDVSLVSGSRQRAYADLEPARLDAMARGLPAHGEAALLQAVSRDRYGRRHWLQPAACRAWSRMHQAARDDGVELEIVSSFRSYADQCRILRRKLRQGQDWPSILRVSAAPGYSEHHTGCAVDLAAPGQPVLTEDFERTRAFAWLQAHAAGFSFHLSYPRDNPWGFIHEPWHWRFRPAQAQLSTTGP